MTYDIAVWKQNGSLTDRDAAAEFERRFEDSDQRYPDYRPAIPELAKLAGHLEEHFPEAPWEELREALDGEFLYLTIGGSQAGSEVENYLLSIAPALGLLVYSPMSESIIAQP
jgi:hypothetical protein